MILRNTAARACIRKKISSTDTLIIYNDGNKFWARSRYETVHRRYLVELDSLQERVISKWRPVNDPQD